MLAVRHLHSLLPPILSCVAPVVQGMNFGWNCQNTPEACQNACYAVRCGTTQQITFLTRGDPDDSDDQRKRAGCGGSPCGVLPWANAGSSCDEYPFASVEEGGWDAYQRCIPLIENQRQGAQLGNFYRRNNVLQGTEFYVFLSNYEGVDYCDDAMDCDNDGQQFQTNRALNKRNEVIQTALLAPNRTETSGVPDFREFVDGAGLRLILLSGETVVDFVGDDVDVSGIGVVEIVAEETPN